MKALAVVMEAPGQANLRHVPLESPGDRDIVVETAWSGISAGTERLLWSGRMPDFPGMGYPLVPGYESVGVVRAAGPSSGQAVGEFVFVPGASCFGAVRGLFGGAASRLVLDGSRAVPIPPALQADGTLLALAATAHHALAGAAPPELIVGHGVLGRLLARIAIACGHAPPTVWESQAARRQGDGGYPVVAPDSDSRRDYRIIVDASGDAALLDGLVGRLAHGGEIVLAGFYPGRIGFAFAPAFMREARFRCPAEWQPGDIAAVQALIASGALSLDGLITHRAPARDAAAAYRRAFEDPGCLKMVLDWSDAA